MAAKIFLTGATGYLGGEVLYQVSRLPAKHQIRCLVRSEQKAEQITSASSNVETVIGDLDDVSLIEKEATNADIVLHIASTRHEPSSRAIIKGLSAEGRKSPGHWLQIGGAALFGSEQITAKTYGEPSDQVWDDIENIEEIKTLIKSSPGRIIDNLILAQDGSKVKTALVVGCIIYGKGRGPGNTITIQGPTIADYAIKNGEAFQVGKGESIWSYIHVSDIGSLFVALVEAAVNGKDGVWNDNGIYLPEAGSISWNQFARSISNAAQDQKLITSDNIKSVSSDEANEILAHGAVVLGTNARLSSSRANKYLGWKPAGISLAEDVPRMVKEEAEKFGKQ